MAENPRDRIARHLGLGDYGLVLAEEILDDHREMLARELEDDEYFVAADFLRTHSGHIWENTDD